MAGQLGTAPTEPLQKDCLRVIAAWLISAWQLRYNMPKTVDMSEVTKSNEMDDKKSNARGVSPYLVAHFFGMVLVDGAKIGDSKTAVLP